jgi:hypothetical protein
LWAKVVRPTFAKLTTTTLASNLTPLLMHSSSLASLLDFPSSLSISEQAVRNTVKPQFELRNPYGLSVSRAYKNRATKVLQLAALTIGDE